MKRAFSTAVLLASGLTVGSAEAASVLFVDNEAVDASWKTLIEDGGQNTYTLYNASQAGFDFNPNTQAERDFLNGFDVIVISGSNAAFNAVRSHGANWNTLATPIINTGMYLAGGTNGAGSWNILTGTGSVPGGAQNINTWNVGNASDPIFNGVTLTPGPPETIGDLYDVSVRFLDLNNNSTKAGVTALAINPSDTDQITIASIAPGALQAGGGGGYYIGALSGNSGVGETFTPLGEQIFLNAITALAPPVPEPSSLALVALGGLLVARRRRG